jgi:hypothetical protein
MAAATNAPTVEIDLHSQFIQRGFQRGFKR